MTAFLILVHILISLFLILVVLLQQGKGADLAGAFGGGGSQTVFGARGATTVLHKATTILFILFVLSSMILAVMQARPRGSVMKNLPASAAPAAKPAPKTLPPPATTQTVVPVTPAPAPVTPAP